jgi:hypothetical protein
MTQRRGIDLLRQGWPFALLCLAASSEGWITDTWPQAGSTLASETVACALAAALSFGLAFLKPMGPIRLSTSSAAWGGALILTGPAIGLFLMSSLGPANRVLALALTPVVVAVAEAAVGTQEHGLSARSLWPGLAAVSGLLLVLPEPSLASPLNDAALLLAPLLTGIGCTLFRRHHTLEDMDATESATTTFAGACLLFGLGTAAQSALQHTLPVPSFAAVAIDLILTLLSIFALQRLTATQYAARYVLVPLAILALSLLQVHETITARSLTCALLLAGAAISLLMQSDRQENGDLNVVVG